MSGTEKYDFSFTASSLRLSEMVLVAKHHLDGTKVDFVNELGKGKSATGKRMYAEFSKRVDSLTKEELELLVLDDLTVKKQIGYLAVCKTHPFIRDFVVEVLREKVLMYDYEISEGDYISFYRSKSETHREMEKLTEVTQRKIRQVLFKILEQAGIIDSVKSRQIQPQILDERIIKAIVNDNKEWLKIFFLSDYDISQYNKN